MKPNSKKQYIQDLAPTIQNLIDSGLSLSESCTKLGLAYHATYALLKRHTSLVISTKTNGKSPSTLKAFQNKIKIPDSELETIKDLYFNEMMCLSAIGKRYNTTGATIMSFMKRHNMIRRTHLENKIRMLERPEYRAQLKDWGVQGYLARRTTRTKPEQLFAEFLERNNIEYEEQFRRVGNKHPYDFRLKDYNTLVEIDGHYWHSKPEQIAKDKKHTEDAISKGFHVLRICTSQLKTDSFKNILERFLNEHGFTISFV